MKRVVLFIFLLAAGSFILSSCGGNTKKENGNKTPEKKEVKQQVEKKVEKTFTANIENGKKVYNKVCVACHMTGVAGAPALKDKKRWEEIAQKSMKTLHNDAINGFTGKHGVMPPKGTCTDCSDQDLYDAVAYMLKTAGVSAKE
jgi:cytochrome c5